MPVKHSTLDCTAQDSGAWLQKHLEILSYLQRQTMAPAKWHPLPEAVARAARAPGGRLLPGGCRAVGGRPRRRLESIGRCRAARTLGCWFGLMLLEEPGGKHAAAVARVEQASDSPQECEPRRGARRPGSFWAPRRLRRQPRSAPGASCGGVAAGAQAAADPAIPQSATGAHLCRDKAIRGFSKHQSHGGQMLDVLSCALY
ncbi:uncharacterized protein [Alexandromys fortis]|uniref:uncharacterized protein n=1 Tax=Alexandromys fortis TaxID=100897 RepID=UPI0021528EB3|nr:uncharacterized protein LOC126487271 [Microtus fortis]